MLELISTELHQPRASRSVAWILKDGENICLLCRRTLTLKWNFQIFRNKFVILNFLSFQSKNNFFNLSWDLTCRKWNWFSCNRGNIDRYSISSFIKNDHDHHSKIIMKDFEKMKNLSEFDRFDDSQGSQSSVKYTKWFTIMTHENAEVNLVVINQLKKYDAMDALWTNKI